ncbi:hypothetical protein [Microseira sp. BLCC-F43]|uniref:hypothetical protein n=1 Tax=Microseira sp. BLCC-F43 TaxID=3153602 RepID=UPI0035BB1A35
MVKKLGLNAAFAVGTDLSGLRYDAYMAYNFVIEIDGLLTGNFSEVTGLESKLGMPNYLDPKLIHRLLRPIERPGVINTGMGWEIVKRAQQFTNRLPLLSHLTQRWNRKIGFQGDQIPIVYAQPQPQETPTTRSISPELGQSPSSQRMVVQAKFAPGSAGANRLVQTTNDLAGETHTPQEFLATKPTGENFPSSQLMVVQAKFVSGSDRANRLVQKTNPKAGETPTPQEFLATKPRGENFPSSQTTVVQAKFVSGSDRSLFSPKPTPISTTVPIEKPPLEQSLSLNSPNLSLETKAINIARQLEDLSGETIHNPRPIVRARSQPLPASDRIIFPGANLPSFVESIGEANAFDTSTAVPNLSGETIQNPKSKIQNPMGWSGLETPLVFSSPHVNTESVQTELEAPNPGITGISRTEGMTQTTGLSREVSQNIQSNEESNIQQPNRQDSSNIQISIDMEALTDKIERQLMQRLIIESEPRVRTTWS